MHWQLGVRSPFLRRCFAICNGSSNNKQKKSAGTPRAKAEVNTIGAASLNQTPYYTHSIRSKVQIGDPTEPEFFIRKGRKLTWWNSALRGKSCSRPTHMGKGKGQPQNPKVKKGKGLPSGTRIGMIPARASRIPRIPSALRDIWFGVQAK
ncbi:hypothetical protein L3X38_000208 (mitochondrion) [Prunus dulcis]|uniref:Uncharacterized protein n=1 Tax=Prunus dulcis TaxID=3755 RepID=A0AAD4YHK2_PRUDU|nr:hypothetical protein L3X38_000208 [Prunus dulcis]